MLIESELKTGFQEEEIRELIYSIEWFISEITFFKDAPEILLKALKQKAKQLDQELL